MYGVFMTPKMRALMDKMDDIEKVAISRSGNDFFPLYTRKEVEELKKLHAEYRAEKEMEGL